MKRQSTSANASRIAAPLAEILVGVAPVSIEFWDGSSWGPENPIATIRLRSKDALKRILWAPGELGVARAFVAGEIDIDGNLIETLRALRSGGQNLRRGWRMLPRIVASASRLGIVGRPLSPPPEEIRPRGMRHSLARDAKAVGHHYDVGNDFYRLVLGPSMTYSCAHFSEPTLSLTEAQVSKYDLVCRKLGLHERTEMRLLDVGCGWGSMALHAASRYKARVVGVTISGEQFTAATARVGQAGLADRIEIRLEDYRQLAGERFDAISSIGMSEHVGKACIGEYFSTLASLLSPRGRLLNHAISSVGGSKLGPRSFMNRYVFPDGELLDVGDTVLAMEKSGLEVRDIESLREHYALTLRHWVANIEE
ncbi:MAG: cyclopropane-fatty-acyl-phospholipid synthase family protein, partial [Ilumatobacteraceae bacterium]